MLPCQLDMEDGQKGYNYRCRWMPKRYFHLGMSTHRHTRIYKRTCQSLETFATKRGAHRLWSKLLTHVASLAILTVSQCFVLQPLVQRQRNMKKHSSAVVLISTVESAASKAQRIIAAVLFIFVCRLHPYGPYSDSLSVFRMWQFVSHPNLC